MTVLRTSRTGANALTTRLSGATCLCGFPLESVHSVRMERESFPTGIEMPSAGHRSRATARTVSNRFASSPSSPQAHIQFADNFTSPISPMSAAAMFMSDSTTASRPDAGAEISATLLRSPIAMACPVVLRYEVATTATSAIGTW